MFPKRVPQEHPVTLTKTKNLLFLTADG